MSRLDYGSDRGEMTLYAERLQGWVAPADVFTAFYAEQENAFWLDRETHESEPFSVIGGGNAAGPELVDQITNLPLKFDSEHSEGTDDLPFAFRPGIVGVIAYESGLASNLWISVDRALVFDHRERHIYFLAEVEGRQQFENWLHAALLRLALIGGNSKLWCHKRPPARAKAVRPMLRREEYKSAVSLVKASIAAGDAYQVCLTNRLRGEYTDNPLTYFLNLRSLHSAPYAGYLRIGQTELISISPERLLTVARNKVWSSPIKGTRARGVDLLDEHVVMDLQSDPKERAENLMIVDLLRNDLLKVCEPSSVVVEQLLEVKTYSTMHQLVSQVRGQLGVGVCFSDVVAACFPAGSMTGAPKLAAMEMIRNLEPAQRGLYSGGLGYLSSYGTADFGMVIRSVIFRDGEFEIGIGGGLTSDSDPEREFQEMTLKAKALIEGLKISPTW